MRLTIREGLTFDDVLLVPKYSKIDSRSIVDISVNIGFRTFLHPIIPANMQSVTGEKMADAVIKSGGLAILHRFMPIEEQLEIIGRLSNNDLLSHSLNNLAVSVGVKENHHEDIKKFFDKGIKIFCIDIAHGDSKYAINMTEWIRDKYPQSLIISGNVATGNGAKRLWEAGADIVKVGIGPGSLCTTRIETGNGVPQLTALIDVADFKNTFFRSQDKYIIADGGIKNAGDIVKALCFADMVMTGNIFAGCVETPGTILSITGKSYKEYRGSSTHKANHIEGVVAIVPTKGKYKNILEKLLEGLRSGCSYQGAHNISELKDNPEFIKITNAGLIESKPHDIII